MGNVFLTGCTHFGHANIIKFESKNRPFATIEEHDEYIVDSWNKTVGPDDTVYHLGDIVFPFKAMTYLGRLNGNKKAIFGNHDRHPIEEYRKYFEIIGTAFRLDDILLSHYPVHPICFDHRELFNAHCHIHSLLIDDPRYINVSVEHWDMRPVSIEDIRYNLTRQSQN